MIWILLLYVAAVLASPLKGDTHDLKDFLVSSLPGLYSNIPKGEVPLMFAGQLELYPENNTHYFFWKFSDKHKVPEAQNRTIFWLNGGPGCSSMDGALMEAGPFRINHNQEVTYNPGLWHKAGDIVFVDQPAGTGFSYTDEYDHDLDQITWEFLRFLERFYEMFPEDADNDIYFAGESYAGQYIPYIVDRILKHNKGSVKPYNVKGLLIGNGWISPNEQSLSYLPFSVQAGLINSDNPQWSRLLTQHEHCQKIVNNIDATFDGKLHDYEVSSGTCEGILNLILSATRDKANPEAECVNMYDFTLRDSYPSCGMNWPPDLDTVKPFLNDDSVKAQINLQNAKAWHECSGNVGKHFKARNSVPAIHLLPGILEEVEVVLFNGNRDIICNYMGTESMIKKLTWGGKRGFSDPESSLDWIHNGSVAGYIQSERNLTFVNVFDASHMVPFDVPEVSRALIDLVTHNFDTDEKVVGGETKGQVKTFPLGERQAREAKKVEAKPTTSATTASTTSYPSAAYSSYPLEASDSDSDSDDEHPQESTSRITRLIQLLVIAVLIWGVIALYNSYRSRPTSIIKTRPNSGRKKNVQWADQLRQFQEDNDIPQQGILSKALNKLKRSDGRGTYAPTASDDIELQSQNTDDFVISSDEETPK